MQITIIGGGSYQWTPELLADLMGTPSLQGMDLVLEDIDAAPLAKMEPLARKLADAMDAKVTVSSTTDQRKSLEGADFVIVTISTGGFESMGVDLDVPARHGIRQSVGDSVGPGGVNRALRNIPVLVGIAKDMDQVCPDAWLLNITNPMTTLTRSVCREAKVKTVGLCHEVGNWTMDLAVALGKSGDDVHPTVVGVNHFPVVTALDVAGEDGFAILHDIVEECGGLDALVHVKGEAEAEPFSHLDFARRHVLKLTLLERWGAIPAAGDRHVAEFLPSILTEESRWGRDFNVHLTTIEHRELAQMHYIENTDQWLSGEKDLQTWQSGELPAPVIDSLITGTRREVPVNIPNAGQCPDLPADAVVESICIVDDQGIRGRDQAHAPTPFTELLRRHIGVQELTVEAALSGDRKLAAAAFALDPLAGRGDFKDTQAMADELLDGTAQWLPRSAAAGA